MTCSSCHSASASQDPSLPLIAPVLGPEDIVKIFFAAFKLTLPVDILTAISFSVVELVSVFVILNESVEEFVAFLKAQGFSDIKLSVAKDVTTVTATNGGPRLDLGKNDDIPILPDIILTPENLPAIFFELFKLSLPVNVEQDLLGSAVEFAVVFLTQDNEVQNLIAFLNENGFRVPFSVKPSAASATGSSAVTGLNGGIKWPNKCPNYPMPSCNEIQNRIQVKNNSCRDQYDMCNKYMEVYKDAYGIPKGQAIYKFCESCPVTIDGVKVNCGSRYEGVVCNY